MQRLPSFAECSSLAIFTTKAVMKETGIAADTMRSWERRYGLPCPQRSAGGHRLYSERDIAIMRWLQDRTSEGMNISQAVVLLQQALADGMKTADFITEHDGLESLAIKLSYTLTAFDSARADQLLGEAFALYPFEDVLLKIIQSAFVDIGVRWEQQELGIAAEHFATEYIRRKIASLSNLFEHQQLRGPIIIGCAPGEQHDLGALYVSLILQRSGWRVLYFGTDLPCPDLIEMVRAVQPKLVGLSSTTMCSIPGLIECAQAMQQHVPYIYFGYGGQIFNKNPELQERIPGKFLGNNIRVLHETVADLCQ